MVRAYQQNEKELRERYRKMDDAALLRSGRAAKYMISPEANFGRPPRDCFVQQLRIAREVWLERHPKQDIK
jgi:hypothetical protein